MVFAVSVMVGEGATVTFVVTSAKPGELARITVVPWLMAVSLKPITCVDALKVTKGPTIATAGLLDDRLKVVFDCAGPERVSVKVVSEPAPSKVTFAGESEADKPTVTRVEAVVKPGAVAVMVVVPSPVLLRITVRLGVV